MTTKTQRTLIGAAIVATLLFALFFPESLRDKGFPYALGISLIAGIIGFAQVGIISFLISIPPKTEPGKLIAYIISSFIIAVAPFSLFYHLTIQDSGTAMSIGGALIAGMMVFSLALYVIPLIASGYSSNGNPNQPEP